MYTIYQTTLGGPPRPLWESLPEYSVQSTVQSTAWSKYSIEYRTAQTLPDHSGRVSQTSLGGPPRPLWESLPDHSGRVSQTTLGGSPRPLWESLPEYSVQSTVQHRPSQNTLANQLNPQPTYLPTPNLPTYQTPILKLKSLIFFLLLNVCALETRYKAEI